MELLTLIALLTLIFGEGEELFTFILALAECWGEELRRMGEFLGRDPPMGDTRGAGTGAVLRALGMRDLGGFTLINYLINNNYLNY